jgi:hypothetical protein
MLETPQLWESGQIIAWVLLLVALTVVGALPRVLLEVNGETKDLEKRIKPGIFRVRAAEIDQLVRPRSIRLVSPF